MTKYILLGGYLSKAQDAGQGFAEELVKGFGGPARILICLFARSAETWAEIFEKECTAFRAHLPDANLEFQLADPFTFDDQVHWANAMYMRGGNTDALITVLQRSDKWMNELDGKTLAGSSAGADAIATYHFNLDTKSVGIGLGILPIKVIPHWRSDYGNGSIDWDSAYAELDAYGETLPIVTLAEGEYKIFTS